MTHLVNKILLMFLIATLVFGLAQRTDRLILKPFLYTNPMVGMATVKQYRHLTWIILLILYWLVLGLKHLIKIIILWLLDIAIVESCIGPQPM